MPDSDDSDNEPNLELPSLNLGFRRKKKGSKKDGDSEGVKDAGPGKTGKTGETDEAPAEPVAPPVAQPVAPPAAGTPAPPARRPPATPPPGQRPTAPAAKATPPPATPAATPAATPPVAPPAVARPPQAPAAQASTPSGPTPTPADASEPTQVLPATPAPPAQERPGTPLSPEAYADQAMTRTAVDSEAAEPTSRPSAPKRAAKPPREFRLPHIDGRIAAVLSGIVAGLVAVLLTFVAGRGCEIMFGTGSCGGGVGLLALIIILVASVVVGAAVLKAWQISDPTSTSFLGVGLVAVIAMLFFLSSIDSVWMFLVIPGLSALTFLLSWWVTQTFVEVDDS